MLRDMRRLQLLTVGLRVDLVSAESTNGLCGAQGSGIEGSGLGSGEGPGEGPAGSGARPQRETSRRDSDDDASESLGKGENLGGDSGKTSHSSQPTNPPPPFGLVVDAAVSTLLIDLCGSLSYYTVLLSPTPHLLYSLVLLQECVLHRIDILLVYNIVFLIVEAYV